MPRRALYPSLVAVLLLTAGCGPKNTGQAATSANPPNVGASSSAPTGTDQNTPAAASSPLPLLPPSHGKTAPTCGTVFYTLTKQGVDVDVTVRDPEYVTVEADDAGDNPVGGDTTKASGSYVFKGADLHHVIPIPGIHDLDHVNVLPPGNPADACNAYRR
jgi:hypothetical protein